MTFQSMRRTSSPGWYCAGLAELGAVAGHEAEVLAVQQAVEAPADRAGRGGAGPAPGCPTWTSARSAAGADTVGSGAAVVGAVVGRRGREAPVVGRRSRRVCRRRRRRCRRPARGEAASEGRVVPAGLTWGAGTVESTRARIWSADDALGERLVGEHQAVAQHVGGDVEHVLGEHVAAAPQQGEGPAGGDQAEAGPGAGAVGDERRDVARACSSRGSGWRGPG